MLSASLNKTFPFLSCQYEGSLQTKRSFTVSLFQISGLVVVNIDNGSVSVTKETLSNYEVVTKTIPDFPLEPAVLFKKVCTNLKFHTELTDVQR